jgi:signal transduction histidine kinase
LFVPRSFAAKRWTIASVPIVGIQLAIIAVWVVGIVTLLPWLEGFGSVATALLFAWPLLLPLPNARWDLLLLTVIFALLAALVALLAVDSLSAVPVPHGIWGSLGALTSLLVVIGITVSRPYRWAIFISGYSLLLIGFLVGTWVLPETLPLLETVVYPAMSFFAIGMLLESAQVAEPLSPFAAFTKAIGLFEQAMEPKLLTNSGLRLITYFLRARYGLVLRRPDQSGGMAIVAAVDSAGLREPSGPPLQGKALPEVTSSIVRARAKVLHREPEIHAIKDALGLDEAGEGLIAPIRLEADRLGGLLLIAGSRKRNWLSAELETLEAWSSYLGRRINEWSEGDPGIPSEEAEMLKGELRLALEELAEVSAVESSGSIAQVGTLTSLLTEMREPIASIQGYEELFRGGATGELDSEQLQFLDHITQAAAQLDHQLTGLLDLVATPRGAIQSQIEIREVVDIAAAQVASDLRNSGIQLKRELPESLPAVKADADILRQVIVILIERAIQISPDDSQIRVSARADDDGWISIAVSDQGPGLPAEDLGRAFQASEGALPQVKLLTDSLGGRVWIGSEMGAGSTVTVLIPISEGTVANAS